MTVYEKNYQDRLNEMLAIVKANYGKDHHCTEYFEIIYKKYFNYANYENRETVEKIFKGLVKNA